MTKFEFLDSLAIKYNTDKRSEYHGYTKYYSEYLPDRCRSMLEIGIEVGASALMWNDFYGNETLDLHYLDLFINPDFVSPRWCRNRGFVPHIGSQASLPDLVRIKEYYDVIIDDGSHVASHMLISFKHLFINNLAPQGTYVIEDCHCNMDNFYWGEGVERFEETPLYMFKEFKETGHINNKFFSQGEAGVFESVIDWVEISCEDKLIFIKRK